MPVNSGIGGSGLVSFYFSASGSYAKLCQVYKCRDDFFIVVANCDLPILYNNFLDAREQGHFFWVNDGTANFENCVFLYASGKSISGNGRYVFNNCSTNENIMDLRSTKNCVLNEIEIPQKKCYEILCMKTKICQNINKQFKSTIFGVHLLYRP